MTRPLPGFRLTLTITIVYVAVLVVLPLSGLFLKTATLSGSAFWETVTSPRALASYRLSFVASFAGASITAVFGTLVAWVLVRYRFPGRAIADAIVDLPFALPTAVSGLTLTALYSKNGWFGRPLEAMGMKVAFAPLGVVIALAFVGLPFVVRAVQPVLESLDRDVEEAAAVLGASRWGTFRRVIFPTVLPALLTGFTMSFARGVGEYGSIVFISGNMPMKTEITPLLIVTKLEQYDYPGATALAVVLLSVSVALLFLVSLLQKWVARRAGVQLARAR